MATTPPWAEELKESICPGLPLKWRTSRSPLRVRGRYYAEYKGKPAYISMSVGRLAGRVEQQWILVHECAHRLANLSIEGRPSHREAYYRLALPLYRRVFNDVEYAEAMGREFLYKSTAQRTFGKLILEGHEELFFGPVDWG